MNFKREIESKDIGIMPYIPLGCEPAYQILFRELEKGKDAKILTYYDPDIDGMNSGLITDWYLGQLGYKTQYCINTNRAHGFKLSDKVLEQLKGGLIIAVDFSITKPEFDRILRAGVNVINIDHHEIEIEKFTKNSNFVCSKYNDAYGVILNNQYPEENERFRFLSGAGMVYYFFKYVSEKVNVPLWNDYAAMVGISLLSDIRPLESKEAYKFLEHTFNIQSEYFQYLVWLIKGESRIPPVLSSFGLPRVSREFVDFNFSPMFNSMLRANFGEDCVKLLKGDESTFDIIKSNDTLNTCRKAQKTIISETLKLIENDRDVIGSYTREYSCLSVGCVYSDVQIKGYDMTRYNITNYVGVACSQMKKEGQTGVVFVLERGTNKVVRGSVRGGIDGVDYLSIFKRHGIECAGHHNAFGVISCDLDTVDFEKIDEEIANEEKKFKEEKGFTMHVLEVYSMAAFIKSPSAKAIYKINEYFRDNHRVFVKYVGPKDNIKVKKISDKYVEMQIENVSVVSFNPSLTVEHDLLMFYKENKTYGKCVLREGFEYDHSIEAVELFNIYQDSLE